MGSIYKKIVIGLSIALLAIILLWFLIHFREQQFQVVFFNVGQGDSALIKFENGQKMLVDCGPDKKVLAKLGENLPFYDRAIDFLLITHFDLDHYGGCIDVLKRYKVENIITNGGNKPADKYWQAWDMSRKNEQSNEIIISQISTWEIADSKLEFLWPDLDDESNTPSLKKDSNNQSIVFRLVHSSTTILFTGDMEEKVEKILVESYCSSTCPALESKILKAGHHGSGSSSSEGFLRSVSPQKAIISTGKNSFGHPSLRVLRKLERQSIEILRTDELGDIIIR
ncbi:MAG: MBL fold metallo-hydrolase [bacterium]